MSNPDLAIAARDAINTPGDDSVETRKGYCQRFVRQVMQRVYGNKYNAYYQDSARETAEEFRAHGIGFAPDENTIFQEGDILYKQFDSQDGRIVKDGFGHVGIFVGRVSNSLVPLVAENSSTKIGRTKGALGYRTLTQFCKPTGITWVVRLKPPVAKTWEA
jgi:hypothetical protein